MVPVTRNVTLERFLWACLIAILAGVSGFSIWKIRDTSRAVQPLEPGPAPSIADLHRQVPDFSLVDQNGKTVTRADLAGQVWVADFFFTHCTGKCPMVTSRMADVQRAVPKEASVKLVSITVDPERDSPAVLAKWAADYGAQDDRWLFLTGDKNDIIRLCKEGFLLPMGDNPSDHSFKLMLVDRAGIIRGSFQGTDENEVAELKKKIRSLASENQP